MTTYAVDDQPHGVRLPWVYRGLGKCRSCGADVVWAEHEHTLKKSPFDMDGTTSHFSTCPDAASWRRR